MKKNKNSWLWVIFLCSLFAACKKDKTEPSELSTLPPSTQTGANTFGCLVNGKAWVAQRNDCSIFCDANFKIFYDASYGGSVSLISYFIDIKNNRNEKIVLSFDSTNYKNIFIFQNKFDTKCAFTNYASSNNCTDLHSIDSSTVALGKIQLSRYDLSNGIISGTFEFTLYKTGCELINITDGRFDKKL